MCSVQESGLYGESSQPQRPRPWRRAGWVSSCLRSNKILAVRNDRLLLTLTWAAFEPCASRSTLASLQASRWSAQVPLLDLQPKSRVDPNVELLSLA